MHGRERVWHNNETGIRLVRQACQHRLKVRSVSHYSPDRLDAESWSCLVDCIGKENAIRRGRGVEESANAAHQRSKLFKQTQPFRPDRGLKVAQPGDVSPGIG